MLTGYLLGRYRPVEVSSLAPVSMYLFAPALVFQCLRGTRVPGGRLGVRSQRHRGQFHRAVGLAGPFGLAGAERAVFVLAAAMPAAVNTFLFASEFRCEPGFVAMAVFTTTLASFVTVSLLLLWLL